MYITQQEAAYTANIWNHKSNGMISLPPLSPENTCQLVGAADGGVQADASLDDSCLRIQS